MSKRKIRIAIKEFLIVVVALLTVCLLFGEKSPITSEVESYIKPTLDSDKVFVHFIDVGQGSCVLIQQGEQGILIDSGEDSYSERVSDYVLSCGVESFSYVIATHPHSDHIGGLDEIIESYTVSEVVMPCVAESYVPDSGVYNDFIGAIDSKKLTVNYADVGEKLTAGDISVEILGPSKQSSNLNNMSVICKVDIFSTNFLFMGDAESSQINSVYSTYSQFDCDVLHVPHHGSDTALHNAFFDSITAEVAVISCGEDNSYGHPHQQTLDYYTDNGCEIYRTDIDGDVVFSCTSEGYSIEL